MTLETSPDKKTGVGSLRKPREYDGRLPPDAGYYLDLVIPRKEEPPKKTGSPGEIIAWKNITNKVIDSHAIYSRILANLLVRLSSCISKFTGESEADQNEPYGGHGGGRVVLGSNRPLGQPPQRYLADHRPRLDSWLDYWLDY